ncbi:LOW QUALITY PROTEIN: hypothetical protein OSB04_004093 [Centaurea solstitialis]|uniref:Reverse transcriptase zinc-binding domain-containing protein n=1 Tax=Centaurea solstitialis TaxID=347529 RepID=A0AA38WNT9_9ASTR|nr:LOW QUALITY PROTEIN: hypothetical protein OSB04_004093 [Centaurea solstitialis]
MDSHGTPSGSRRRNSASQTPPPSASQTPPPSGVYRPAMGFGSWLPPSGWPKTPMVDNWAYANMMANTPMMSYPMHPQQPTTQTQQPTTQTQQPTPSQMWEPRDGTDLSPQSWGDDEEVPETQPESPPPPPPPQPKGKKRGKGKNVEASSSANPTKTKAPPKPWTSDEEVELAKSWAEISEDSTIGNYRTGDNFWMHVKMSLDKRMGYGPNVRSSDAVQTKVKLLLSGVSKFACIYNNVLNHRGSGESGVDLLERALERYRREYNRTFPFQAAWKVLIQCPKYNPVEMMNPSDIRAPTNKRSKTSETQTDSPGDSDARTYTHLGDSERPRPMGRKAARRAGSSSSTNDTNSGMSTEVGALTHGITGLVDILKEKQRMAHLQFYTSPHNHLSGHNLETTLREKARLRELYDWAPFEYLCRWYGWYGCGWPKKSGVWLNIAKAGDTLETLNVSIDDFFTRSVMVMIFIFGQIGGWGRFLLGLSFQTYLLLNLINLLLYPCAFSHRSDGRARWRWAWLASTDLVQLPTQILALECLLQHVSLNEGRDLWRWEVILTVNFRCIPYDKSSKDYYVHRHLSNVSGISGYHLVLIALYGRIPTRMNLCSRSLPLATSTCPFCELDPETEEHLFYSCSFTKEIWKWLINWCNLNDFQHSSLQQLFFGLPECTSERKKKCFLEAVVGTTIWFVWKCRNDLVFNRRRCSISMMADEIQATLFTWVKYRAKCNSLSWSLWCCNPLLSL